MDRVPTSASRLQELERRQRQLASKILDLGFVHQGTVVHRPTRCQTPGCRCHADPPQLHGPYWQLTRYRSGKTMTRRLSEPDAALYREWIANRRHLAEIIAEMEQVGEEAAHLLVQQADPERRSRRPKKPTT
jgi:hypothetical protein